MGVLRYKMPPFPNLAADDDVSHTGSFPTSIKVGRSTKVVCFPEFFFYVRSFTAQKTASIGG